MESITPSNFPILLAAFIFGSITGSFLNVCIYRLPREESVSFPPSHCTSCNKPIRFYDNIPILSYLVLGGKCRNCGEPYSPIYLIVELLTGLAAAGLVRKFGLTPDAVFYFLFVCALLVITFIDLEHMIIPNVISLPGIIIGLIFAALRTDWGSTSIYLHSAGFNILDILLVSTRLPILDSVLGILFGGGMLLLIALLYKVLRKREGLGMGDVKLLAMIGAFLGWKSVIFVTLISSLVGTVVGIAIMLYKREDMGYALPFGPFLSIAAIIYLFAAGTGLFSP